MSFARRARRLVRTPPRDLLTAAHVVMVIAAVEALIRWVPLPRLSALFGVRLNLAPVEAPAEQLALSELSPRARRQVRARAASPTSGPSPPDRACVGRSSSAICSVISIRRCVSGSRAAATTYSPMPGSRSTTDRSRASPATACSSARRRGDDRRRAHGVLAVRSPPAVGDRGVASDHRRLGVGRRRGVGPRRRRHHHSARGRSRRLLRVAGLDLVHGDRDVDGISAAVHQLR